MDSSDVWAKAIARYPERFGRLSGLYWQLLQEAKIVGLPAERVNYFHSAIIGVDKSTQPMYDISKLTNPNKAEQDKTEGDQ